MSELWREIEAYLAFWDLVSEDPWYIVWEAA